MECILLLQQLPPVWELTMGKNLSSLNMIFVEFNAMQSCSSKRKLIVTTQEALSDIPVFILPRVNNNNYDIFMKN
jgi:hypothetical protein